MENPVWKKEFDACYSSSDYEAYVRKYYYHTDNPYLEEAKRRIGTAAKARQTQVDNQKGGGILILIGIVLALAAVGLISVSKAQDGKSYTEVYHGPHGDFKHENTSVWILGPGAGLAGLACAGGALYCFYTGINLIRSKK